MKMKKVMNMLSFIFLILYTNSFMHKIINAEFFKTVPLFVTARPGASQLRNICI